VREKGGRSGKAEMSGEWQGVEGRGQVERGTAVGLGVGCRGWEWGNGGMGIRGRHRRGGGRKAERVGG